MGLTFRKLVYLLQKLSEFSRNLIYCSTKNRISIFYFDFMIISTCIHSYLRHDWRMTKWDTIHMTESLVYGQALTTIKCLFFIFRSPVLLYFEAKQNFNIITSSSERASMLHHKMFCTYIKILCTVFYINLFEKDEASDKKYSNIRWKYGFPVYLWITYIHNISIWNIYLRHTVITIPY